MTVSRIEQLKKNAPNDFSKFLVNGAQLKDYKEAQINNDSSLLRYDEWKEIDEQVLDVVRTRLDAVQDLLDAGLTQDLGGLGTMISEYERQSDISDADISMSPQARSDDDTQSFDLTGVPIPIVHKDFSLNIRRLLASRRRGDGLDVSVANAASRKVSEASESMVVNGADIQFGDYQIYGYMNHPNAIDVDAAGEWSNDIANIYPTIQNMVAELNSEGWAGPYTLYVNPNEYEIMRDVYSDGSGDSVLNRIEDQFPEIDEIKKLHELDESEVVMVQLTSDVIDLAVAETPESVEWDSPGGFQVNFKVMAAWAPRIKSDYNGKTGIARVTDA